MTRHVSTMALSVWCVSGCGGGVVRRVDEAPPVPTTLGCIAVATSLTDVTIEVDGVSMGALSAWRDNRFCVRPSARTFRFASPGRYPLTVDLTLEPGVTVPFTLDLVPTP